MTFALIAVAIGVEEIDAPSAGAFDLPHVIRGADGRTYMSWIEEGPSLRFSAYAGGWSEPLTIAAGGDWFVNWADFPSIAALGDGTLAAHWLEMIGRGTYAYGARIAVSADGGATWSEPAWLHDDVSRQEHGFVTLLPMGDRFGALWLDGRAMAGGGAMSLRFRTIDRDGSLGPEEEVDSRACECCSTHLASSDDGIVAVFRDRGEDEVRDMFASRRTAEGWSPPASVHDDGWRIAGCPVNGPRVVSDGRLAAVAWYTAAPDGRGVYTAFSEDGGRTFGDPIGVDTQAPDGRVDIVLLHEREALVAWLASAEGGAEWRVARVGPAGVTASAVVTAASSSRSGGFARMAPVEEGVLIAWTDPTRPAPRVRAAIVR